MLSRLLVGYDGSDGANAAAAFGLAHVIPEADAVAVGPARPMTRAYGQRRGRRGSGK